MPPSSPGILLPALHTFTCSFPVVTLDSLHTAAAPRALHFTHGYPSACSGWISPVPAAPVPAHAPAQESHACVTTLHQGQREHVRIKTTISFVPHTERSKWTVWQGSTPASPCFCILGEGIAKGRGSVEQCKSFLIAHRATWPGLSVCCVLGCHSLPGVLPFCPQDLEGIQSRFSDNFSGMAETGRWCRTNMFTTIHLTPVQRGVLGWGEAWPELSVL